MRQSRPTSRRGGITVIVAMMLIPLLALVAFAVDLNSIYRTDAELQNAADASALAGASQLLDTRLLGSSLLSGGGTKSAINVNQLLQNQVTPAAVRYAQFHRAGDVDLVMNSQDVEFGYIADPTAKPDTASGQFVSGSLTPNSVRVTVRRDGSVSTGPLRLPFGAVLGTPTSSRTATATATLRGGSVTGFNGSGNRLLPLVMSVDVANALLGIGPEPSGCKVVDAYTCKSPYVEGTPAPPANVTQGPDGVPEVSIFTNSCDPGNFGLCSLTNGKATSQTTYDSWIRNGASSVNLATFGATGLQSPATLFGGPGLKPTLSPALQSIIGQPRTVLLISGSAGNGGNATYQVVGYLGVMVTSCDLSSSTPYVNVQLSPVIDPSATLGSAGAGRLVYKGISLSR